MKRRLLCFTLLVTVTACSPGGGGPVEQAAPAPPAPSATAQPKPLPFTPPAHGKALPFDTSSLEEQVRIQLDQEPRLHSPIRTVITPAPQQYTLFFRTAMDPSSVEEAIRQRAIEMQKEREEFVVPDFSFHWANERQLQLTVSVPATDEIDYGMRRYLIDVQGAKTKRGDALQDPPSFLAVLYTPGQLWRVSLDGKLREQLTSFMDPYYSIRFLDEEKRYLLLSRFMQYCECDADHERIYTVYDSEKRELTPFPFELHTTYAGEGEFVADRRGFFYPKQASGIPAGGNAVSMNLSDHVYGASFSRDHRHLLMAVGKPGQKEAFDFLIRNLDTGKEQRFPRALKGTLPADELTGGTMPVEFHDDGTSVTFHLSDPAKHGEKRYVYSWKTNTVAPWNPPIPEETWSGYTQSSDGVYQLYANGGLFKGRELVTDQVHTGYWLEGTHSYVFEELEETKEGERPATRLSLYDADRREKRIIAIGLPIGTQLIGTSPDGKWIYLQAHADLNQSK
jgi:hypothetical protein